MTASAKGTAEAPGRNVRAKAGLNRSILASGWAGLASKLDYKAAELIEVDPAYTSQTCHECGQNSCVAENQCTAQLLRIALNCGAGIPVCCHGRLLY